MRRILTIWIFVAPLLFTLASCGSAKPDDQAVLHAATAESIKRYRVDEDHVRLVEVERSSDGWLVRAEILSGGRIGTRQIVECRVKRSVSSATNEAQWTLTMIEEQKFESGRTGSRE